MDAAHSSETLPKVSFDRKFFRAIKVIVSLVFGFAAIVLTSDVLLLIFAGFLMAIFFTSLSHWFEKKFKINYGLSLGVVCLTLLLMCIGFGYWAAPSVAVQFDQLTNQIPQSIEKLKQSLTEYSGIQKFINQTSPQDLIKGNSGVIGRATGMVTGFIGGIASFVIILIIGLYGAAEPKTYHEGFIRLFPLQKRKRILEVTHETVGILQGWLIGKFIGMTIIGVLTTIGLWLLNIPLAVILGIIAAILTFIPNIGPILSALPAVLLGFIDSPQKALYIAIMYASIQAVESYLITPLIQKRTVHLPPAFTLSMQLIMGVLFGLAGVALATPLSAAALVISKRLYVEDALGDQMNKDVNNN